MSGRRPTRPELSIQTCSGSLLHPGTCCTEACMERAALAVLDEDFTEHARCETHAGPDPRLTKPLLWDPTWSPVGAHSHRLQRLGVDGELMTVDLPVAAGGLVTMSEDVALRLLGDAGWEVLS